MRKEKHNEISERQEKEELSERRIRAAQAAWIDKKLGYEIPLTVYQKDGEKK